MLPSGSSSDLPPLGIVGPDDAGPVDLDTGSAGREEVAVAVAVARATGAARVRTADPRAARRAAHVVDAIVAARQEGSA